MSIDLHALLPNDKHETQKAEVLVRVGYPGIAPILPEILIWMQDMNWPVAQVFQPFLATIGAPLAPFIRPILSGNDDIWKYWIFNSIIRESESLVAELGPELDRLVNFPSFGEEEAGVTDVAREILGSRVAT